MQQDSRIAKKISALLDMGLERVDSPMPVTESMTVGNNVHKVNSVRPAMGTLVAVTVLNESGEKCEEAIGCAYEEMDRLIALLSRYETDSAVSQLNAQGRMRSLPPEFSHLISRSLQFHALSHGSFDISVEPIVDLFQRHPVWSDSSAPSPGEIADALELVGSKYIEFTSDGVVFKRSGMGVSLNGIAKGYIVDAIAKKLKEHQIENYLINAGGDVRAAGTKEAGLPWTVAVQDPKKGGTFPDTIFLTNAAVATAGSYEKHFDRARRFHHIINSETGLSPQVSLGVSVVAPSAMAADALATSVFVMGPVSGLRLVETLRKCECLIIERSGRILKSNGWVSAAPNEEEKVEL